MSVQIYGCIIDISLDCTHRAGIYADSATWAAVYLEPYYAFACVSYLDAGVAHRNKQDLCRYVHIAAEWEYAHKDAQGQ